MPHMPHGRCPRDCCPRLSLSFDNWSNHRGEMDATVPNETFHRKIVISGGFHPLWRESPADRPGVSGRSPGEHGRSETSSCACAPLSDVSLWGGSIYTHGRLPLGERGAASTLTDICVWGSGGQSLHSQRQNVLCKLPATPQKGPTPALLPPHGRVQRNACCPTGMRPKLPVRTKVLLKKEGRSRRRTRTSQTQTLAGPIPVRYTGSTCLQIPDQGHPCWQPPLSSWGSWEAWAAASLLGLGRD